MKQRILLIEDDPDIQHLVDYNLSREGFEVHAVSDGNLGLDAARRLRPDLILLDIMLPGLAGNEVCKKLKTDRNTQDVPVIFLTAKTDEIDKMIGFELGADDYVTKPFSPRELAARVKAVLRRSQKSPSVATILEFGNLRLDYEKREVTFLKKTLPLSALEFNLFYLMASTPNRVYTRDELLDRLWKGESFVSIRTVDVHIRRLRSKIEQVPRCPHCIKTLRSIGYKFEWGGWWWRMGSGRENEGGRMGDPNSPRDGRFIWRPSITRRRPHLLTMVSFSMMTMCSPRLTMPMITNPAA